MESIRIRPALPGDASSVCRLHMLQYAEQYGFRGIFEYYVMRGMAEFLGDPTGGCLWVAVDGERVVGSIAVVRAGDRTTQLRWFLVHADCRGRGLGRRLMDTAMAFVRERKYPEAFLWTIDMLEAARHLYRQHGFVKTQEAVNTEWCGSELREERWDWRA